MLVNNESRYRGGLWCWGGKYFISNLNNKSSLEVEAAPTADARFPMTAFLLSLCFQVSVHILFPLVELYLSVMNVLVLYPTVLSGDKHSDICQRQQLLLFLMCKWDTCEINQNVKMQYQHVTNISRSRHAVIKNLKDQATSFTRSGFDPLCRKYEQIRSLQALPLSAFSIKWINHNLNLTFLNSVKTQQFGGVFKI